MAYMKYKELTKYFNFNKELDIEELVNGKYKYVKDYLARGEKVVAFYKTKHDKAVFTEDRMILFDVTPFVRTKTIHILPYNSISTSAIQYSKDNAAILLSMDSGYQVRLNFVQMKPKDKTRLRILYTDMMSSIRK